MDINTQPVSSSPAVVSTSDTTASPLINDLNRRDQSTLQSADITVNLTEGAVRVASATEQDPKEPVENESQAGQVAENITQSLNNDPLSALASQSQQVTSTLVANLVGQ